MKKSRKITLVFASILGSLFIMLFFLISCRVDHTPYLKSSYYQNTYDIKTDEVQEEKKADLENLLNEILNESEEDCESCKI